MHELSFFPTQTNPQNHREKYARTHAHSHAADRQLFHSYVMDGWCRLRAVISLLSRE